MDNLYICVKNSTPCCLRLSHIHSKHPFIPVAFDYICVSLRRLFPAGLTPVIPPLWEVEAGASFEVRSFRSAWPTWQNPFCTKNRKINWAWWCMPVIPATWEAEAEELLKMGRQRLQRAEIAPLYFSLGDRARLSQKTKKKKAHFINLNNLILFSFALYCFWEKCLKANKDKCPDRQYSP